MYALSLARNSGKSSSPHRIESRKNLTQRDSVNHVKI